jgi:hypothetical protein
VSDIDGSCLLWLQRLTFLSGVHVYRMHKGLLSLCVVREHLYEGYAHVGRGQSAANGKKSLGLSCIVEYLSHW